MQAALVLQQLWRMRRWVALSAVLAVVIGGLTAYHPGFPPKSRQYQVGVASARALVDTPSSQVVDLGLKEDVNAGVLPARAVLLANLLITTPLKEQTAKRAGVPADHVIAVADTPVDPTVPADKVLATGSTITASDPRANIITVHADGTLPIITVNAQAPDPAVAARLANSALAVLRGRLANLIANQSVPPDRRLVVETLGPARAGIEEKGTGTVIAVVAILFLFSLACGGLLAGAAIRRAWGAAAEGLSRPYAARALEPHPAGGEVRSLPLRPDPPHVIAPTPVPQRAATAEVPAPPVRPVPRPASWADAAPGRTSWDRSG